MVRLHLFWDGGGIDPTGRQFSYTLLAETDGTFYRADFRGRVFQGIEGAETQFAVARKDGGSGLESTSSSGSLLDTGATGSVNDPETFLTPISMRLKPASGSADYRVTVGIRNPLNRGRNAPRPFKVVHLETQKGGAR